MSDRSQQMLCQALDLAESAMAFYVEALANCSGGLGKDVYEKIYQDKVRHKDKIAEVHANMEKGQDWTAACSLPGEEQDDVKALFAEFAEKHGKDTCPASEIAAVDTAIALENKIQKFYQYRIEEAEGDVEKEFLDFILGETRMDRLMLTDLQHYYEDPEAWYRHHEKGGLDGA